MLYIACACDRCTGDCLLTQISKMNMYKTSVMYKSHERMSKLHAQKSGTAAGQMKSEAEDWTAGIYIAPLPNLNTMVLNFMPMNSLTTGIQSHRLV